MVVVGMVVGIPATMGARWLGRRLNAMDGAGVAGQVKAAARRVPNTGGIGIFAGVVLPMLAGIAYLKMGGSVEGLPYGEQMKEQVEGILRQTPLALILIGYTSLLHVIGLIDDRRALGPWFKLAVMIACAAGTVVMTDSRLLTLLDGYVGGAWLSVVVTVLWVVVVTNAFNFMDNMDGLAGGVGAIASGFFLATALVNGQWFIAAMFALVLGSLLGFLVFNFPRRAEGKGATVFMGDGGSLVIGFLIAVLSVRMTYLGPQAGNVGAAEMLAAGGTERAWWLVLIPLMILAVPLYDFASVVFIRISQGRSPFVGDLQHFSHRLVRQGVGGRSAVLVIYGCTMITGIGAVMLPGLAAWQAMLVGGQTVIVLGVIGLYEWTRVENGGER